MLEAVPYLRRFPAVLLLSLAGVDGASSAAWEVSSRLELSETWTDNVNLEKGSAKSSDFVTEIIPGIGLVREAGRVRAHIDYQAEGIVYKDNSDDNNVFHQLDAVGRGEIIDDTFFLDALATYQQQIIDPEANSSLNNRSITDNRTNVGTYSLSPYWRKEIGQSLEALVRYTYGIVRYGSTSDTEDFSDSELHSVDLRLGTQPSNTPTYWTLDYRGAKVNYDDSPGDTFHSGTATVGYRVSTKLAVEGTAGYEKFDVKSDTDQSNTPSSAVWEGRLIWDPRLQDHFEFGVGDRSFGTTYQFQWLHEAARFSSQVNYRQEPETNSTLQVNEGFEGLEEPVVQVEEPGVSAEFRQTDEFFIRKYLDAGLTLRWPKTTVSLFPFLERREYEFGGTDKSYGISGNIRWQFKPRTVIFLFGSRSREEFRDSDEENDISLATMGIERIFGPRTTGSLQYQFTKEDFDDSTQGYKENAITVRFVRTFGRGSPRGLASPKGTGGPTRYSR